MPTPSASASSSSASVRQAEPDILELAGVVRPADGDPAKIQIIGNGFALFEGKRVRVLFRNNPVPYTLVNRNLLDVDLPDPVTDLGDALAVQVYQPDSGSIVEIDIASAFIAVDPGSIQVYDDPGMLLHADPPTGPWPGWTEMVRKAFPHG